MKNLETFLKKLKTDKHGSGRLNLGALEKWLIDNSKIPENDNEPYIVHFEIEESVPKFK